MPVYVTVFDEKLKCELKVTQPEAKFDLETRFEALEMNLYEPLNPKTKKLKTKKKSGFAEIRTQDLLPAV